MCKSSLSQLSNRNIDTPRFKTLNLSRHTALEFLESSFNIGVPKRRQVIRQLSEVLTHLFGRSRSNTITICQLKERTLIGQPFFKVDTHNRFNGLSIVHSRFCTIAHRNIEKVQCFDIIVGFLKPTTECIGNSTKSRRSTSYFRGKRGETRSEFLSTTRTRIGGTLKFREGLLQPC